MSELGTVFFKQLRQLDAPLSHDACHGVIILLHRQQQVHRFFVIAPPPACGTLCGIGRLAQRAQGTHSQLQRAVHLLVHTVFSLQPQAH